jgi:hypothetical protein
LKEVSKMKSFHLLCVVSELHPSRGLIDLCGTRWRRRGMVRMNSPINNSTLTLHLLDSSGTED